jgi:hypothetical protein
MPAKNASKSIPVDTLKHKDKRVDFYHYEGNWSNRMILGDSLNFRRGIELPLALAGLGGEVAHQVLVSVTQTYLTKRRTRT